MKNSSILSYNYWTIMSKILPGTRQTQKGLYSMARLQVFTVHNGAGYRHNQSDTEEPEKKMKKILNIFAEKFGRQLHNWIYFVVVLLHGDWLRTGGTWGLLHIVLLYSRSIDLPTYYGHPTRAFVNIPNILADWADQLNKFWGILGGTICSNFATVYPSLKTVPQKSLLDTVVFY